jgi:hypothetical protein
LFFRI